jgi:hypothetical protein
MHLKSIYLTAIILLCLSGICAQETGRMETDRPDQTESPFIVKKGYFQLESGFNKNYFSSEIEYFLPTTLMKYAMNNKFEFRYISVLSASALKTSFKSEAIGFKIFLFEEKGILPKTSLIAHYHLGDLKRDLADLNRTPHSVGDAVFTSQHQLSNAISIGYNYGIEFHNDGKHEGIFRIAPGITIGDDMYAYIETFGRFPLKVYEDVWVDGGLAYYINDNFKLDISAGRSIKQSRVYYLALGFSCRFNLERSLSSK